MIFKNGYKARNASSKATPEVSALYQLKSMITRSAPELLYALIASAGEVQITEGGIFASSKKQLKLRGKIAFFVSQNIFMFFK